MAADVDARTQQILAEGRDNHWDLAPDVDLSARIEIQGDNNRISLSEGVRVERYAPAGFSATVPDLGRRSDASILIEGHGNVVEIERGVRLAMNMVVRGRNNHIRIGTDAYLHGFLNVITDDAAVAIGSRTTMVQGSLQVHEPAALTIGEDCMISSQVFLSVSDMHPIFDRGTGRRVNPGEDVAVADHVWLGLRTMVLKGSSIGTGAVTAAGSVVSGHVPASSIVAGAPARVVRENIEWRRDLHDRGPDAAIVQHAPSSIRRPWRPFSR